MLGTFCSARAPEGVWPWMAKRESILAKALDSCSHALGASPQPAAVQIRSSRICRGELTAQWRADQFVGNKLAQLKAARRVNHMDVIHD